MYIHEGQEQASVLLSVILADQLALFQPGGHIIPTILLLEFQNLCRLCGCFSDQNSHELLIAIIKELKKN